MMTKWHRIVVWLPLALVATLLYAAARPALTVHETELRGDPAGNAVSVATLPAESEITVFERKGGWYRVESEAGAGWLRLASLRFPSTLQRESDSGVDLLLNSMRTGTYAGRVSSGTTTGVRGLDGSDIDSATPSEAQIEKLEAQASSADAGRAFAAATNLEPVSVAFLERPPRPTRRSSSRRAAPGARARSRRARRRPKRMPATGTAVIRTSPSWGAIEPCAA
jgi:hypothetical protein